MKNFLGGNRERKKTQLIPAFLAGERSFSTKFSRRCDDDVEEGVKEGIVFPGEDGFIIRENFEFVKNGKKDGQKGQEGKFVMLNIKNSGLTFWVECGIL